MQETHSICQYLVLKGLPLRKNAYSQKLIFLILTAECLPRKHEALFKSQYQNFFLILFLTFVFFLTVCLTILYQNYV
jgi:hypothetical protein